MTKERASGPGVGAGGTADPRAGAHGEPPIEGQAEARRRAWRVLGRNLVFDLCFVAACVLVTVWSFRAGGPALTLGCWVAAAVFYLLFKPAQRRPGG